MDQILEKKISKLISSKKFQALVKEVENHSENNKPEAGGKQSPCEVFAKAKPGIDIAILLLGLLPKKTARDTVQNLENVMIAFCATQNPT